MSDKSTSRRTFLGEAACSALGSASIMSTLLSLKMANNAVAAGLDDNPGDCKTLVCVFLFGGIDSFNILVPSDNTRYAQYAAARTNLSLAKDDLLPIAEIDGDANKLYGIHPALNGVQELFNGLADPVRTAGQRRLSFVSNIGTLIERTSLDDYLNERVRLPRALFSHIDQIEQWQTSLPQGGTRLTGWAGRIADVLHTTHNQDKTAMGISLFGNNMFQVGRDTQQFVMTSRGPLSFSQGGDNDHPTAQKNIALSSMMEQEYASLMKTAFTDLSSQSIEQGRFVQEKFDELGDGFVTTPFPDNNIADQLKAALRMIKIRPELGLRRQTIFVAMGGWDHHSDLIGPQQAMLSQLSPALEAFQKGLEELELEDSVITFSASDFGRTLRTNGSGSDHAWGGNQMVMGGPVNGGKIVGDFPSLALDTGLDVGQGGRLLPTTSVDEFFGELLLWFGLEGSSNFDTVLPNLKNFYDVASANTADPNTLPLGFLKPNTF